MSKNIIFQYLITDESVDKRGEIQGRDRKELYLEMADISRKSFEMYAEEIGCEYMYSDEKVFIGDYKMFDFSPLLFECLRVVYDPYFDQFDKVLFADTDIVVNTKENIFDVSDAEIYGVLESDIRTEANGGYNAWDFKDKEFRTYVEKFSMHDCPMMPAGPLHGIGSHPSKLTILNTGVVVWTKEARLKARELFDDWKPWANPKEFGFTIEHHCSIRNDQPFISAQLMKHDFDLESIDQSWNDTPIHYKDSQHWIDSGKCKFLHYTGGDHKVEMVRLYHENKFPIFQEGW